MKPYYKQQLKKVILEYYTRPQKFTDFQKLVYELHEGLIDSDELVIREDGVFKTRILGNR